MKRVVAILIAFALVFSVAGCSAESSKDVSVINAVGSGKITTKPDTLEVRFSVITQGKDKNVQQENASKAQAVIDALIGLGLTKDEMETKSVNFHPLTNWDKIVGEQIIGYRAENSILVTTTKVELAGKITDTAVSSGAEMIGNIAFILSDVSKEKFLEEAIEKAVQDARKQADAAAKAAGVNIIGIKELNVQKNSNSGPIIYNEMLKAQGADAVDTPIIPQNTDYIITVKVSYKIK